jgi:hypothetical protein
MKLNVKAFALTCGLLWGLSLFVTTWWMIATKGVTNDPTWIGQFYIGYRISPLGSVVGLGYALVDGAIGGVIFALVYNWLVRRFTKTRSK